jgi:hypothetical protein
MFAPSGRKKCLQTLMCNWNKCQAEQVAYHASQLTDEDRKLCENKDFKKQWACQEKLTKKKGMLDKLAVAANCEINKCPKIRALNKKMIDEWTKKSQNKKKKTTKTKTEFEKKQECVETHCAKEKENLKQLGIASMDKMYECQKKYTTWKDQTKCYSPSAKKHTLAMRKVYKCSKKHCEGSKKSYTR